MLNFNPERTLRLLARRRHTRTDVAQKPWLWPVDSVAAQTDDRRSTPASQAGTVDVGSQQYVDGGAKTDELRLDDSALRANQRSIARHINDDHYTRSISPGAMVLEGTAAHAIVGSRWGIVSLPDDGTSSAAFFTFERPSEWVTGKLRVTLRYSAPGASVANFRIFLQAGVAKEGSVMTVTALPLSSVNLLPGPAVANTRMSFAVFSSGNVTREFDEISIRIQRTSGHADDVNVNAFHVYGIRVEHISAIQEAT